MTPISISFIANCLGVVVGNSDRKYDFVTPFNIQCCTNPDDLMQYKDGIKWVDK